MEGLLHHNGIFATEVVTVIRNISEAGGRILSIHGRMK